jgi:multisubunit Na+/H+ antiporter MnhB subunit
MNGFAIAALVCGIVFNILGIVFGVIALGQIKRTGEEGRGLALAGIWIGVASLALTVVWFVLGFLWIDHYMQNPPGLQ